MRNLIYELTSYVSENEPISIELVQFVLSKLKFGGNKQVNSNTEELARFSEPRSASSSPGSLRNIDPVHYSTLQSIAEEGDIILPLELCVLRRGETYKQWTARAKRLSIEATRVATGGTLQSVARRLGLTRSSLQGHLHRAKRAQHEPLFELQRNPNNDSSNSRD